MLHSLEIESFGLFGSLFSQCGHFAVNNGHLENRSIVTLRFSRANLWNLTSSSSSFTCCILLSSEHPLPFPFKLFLRLSAWKRQKYRKLDYFRSIYFGTIRGKSRNPSKIESWLFFNQLGIVWKNSSSPIWRSCMKVKMFLCEDWRLEIIEVYIQMRALQFSCWKVVIKPREKGQKMSNFYFFFLLA